jgi:hypothetical protein
MVGRQKIIGNQEEIRFRTLMQLCKYYDPRRGRLIATYQTIAAELISLGVSWRYVADIWRNYKEKIIDSVNSNLAQALEHK